jgi:hypothetical protein
MPSSSSYAATSAQSGFTSTRLAFAVLSRKRAVPQTAFDKTSGATAVDGPTPPGLIGLVHDVIDRAAHRALTSSATTSPRPLRHPCPLGSSNTPRDEALHPIAKWSAQTWMSLQPSIWQRWRALRWLLAWQVEQIRGTAAPTSTETGRLRQLDVTLRRLDPVLKKGQRRLARRAPAGTITTTVSSFTINGKARGKPDGGDVRCPAIRGLRERTRALVWVALYS